MAVTRHNIDKLGISVSKLGFGCMRFPVKDGKIDEVRAEQMLTDAYNAGVNYFDTAYPYHNGESEPFVGRALKKFPRESYYLATKLPCWAVSTLDDAKKLFDLQRSRIDGEYIDFYLLHALDRQKWERVRDLGVVEYLEEKKKEGKIKFLGFSFHDDYEVYEEIINYKDWDFCQIQLNYMDVDDQAGMKGYKLAEQRNVPLVIMEPIKGGLLANLPDEVKENFEKVNPDLSSAGWALRWVSSLPNVKVVLSGMSDEKQLEDNLNTYTDFKEMNEAELQVVSKVADILHKRVNNGCTGCRYCMPCPFGVNIPGNFSIWNRYGVYGNEGDARWHWEHENKEEERADKCRKCGKCESVCPQKISIREDLEKVMNDFAKLGV